MALKSGNYHPGRLVTQLLRHLLERGVQLHTRTAVTGITQATGSDHWVKTARGRIQAKKVLLATNGFTQEIRPELPIAPFQSQVVNFNHVALPSEDPAVFATWTWDLGDVYGHFRLETIYRDAEGQLRGTFLVGGGRDKTLENARSTERDVEAFHEILEKVAQKIPDIKNHPPVRYSRGTMGFPPDRIPLIGEIEPGLYSSAGFAGYGGSWLIQGAAEIASLIAGGHGSPLYQKRFLSPNRFRDGTVVNPLGRPFMNDDAEACARALQKRN
jgi:glycine/D-amino acid oxidase-like deaminating enzyme